MPSRTLTPYTTKTEIKSIMGLSGNSQDTVIDLLIDWASDFIDATTHRWFTAATQTRLYDWQNPMRLALDADLLSVSTLTNGDGAAIPSSAYVLSPASGPPYSRIDIKIGSGYSFVYGATPQRAISVAGTWGKTATPPEIIVNTCNELTIQALHDMADAGLASISVEFATQTFQRNLSPRIVAALASQRSWRLG